MFLRVFIIFSIAFISGCGPVYKTTYYYNEPASVRGRECVIKCQKMRQKCEKWAEESYQTCKLRKSSERIAMAVVYDKDKKNSYYPYSSYDSECNYDRKRKINSCLEDFNACFRLCGGVVDTIEECVANCG